MKDISIFQGVREFDGKRGHIELHEDGKNYKIYRLEGNSFFYETLIEKIDGETNVALYNRAMDAVEA